MLACPRPNGLLEALGQAEREYLTYSKPAMVVLSHAIEDALAHTAPGGLLLCGFQLHSLLLAELDRYRSIAARAAAIHAWGLPDVDLPEGLPPNLYIHAVPPGDPLLRSWFVVARTPDFWTALLAEDVTGFGPDDPQRRFRGGWTSERRAVEAATVWIAERAGSVHPVELLADEPTIEAQLRHEVQTRDITRRLFRHLERSMAARQTALEGQRALAADNARLFRREEALRHEAEQLAELQSLLSHSAVHDLRNALTLSVGSLDLLLAGEVGSLTAEQRELLEAAVQGSARTIDLAQTILDVARLKAGAFPLTRSGLTEQTLGELLEAVARPRRLFGLVMTVDVERPLPPVQADPVLVDRMLGNLLDNAMKYAPRVPVDVGIRVTDDALELAVRGRGPGVPEAARSEIFAPFRQASDDQARRGTGLGLAFCRLASEAHGGSIRLESPPDGGARFVISLPANPA